MRSVYVNARRLESASVVKLNSRRREAATGRFVIESAAMYAHARIRLPVYVCATREVCRAAHIIRGTRCMCMGARSNRNAHNRTNECGAEPISISPDLLKLRRTMIGQIDVFVSLLSAHLYYISRGLCVHGVDKNGQNHLFVCAYKLVASRARHENK